jgi:hypothetical protein
LKSLPRSPEPKVLKQVSRIGEEEAFNLSIFSYHILFVRVFVNRMMKINLHDKDAIALRKYHGKALKANLGMDRAFIKGSRKITIS